MLKTRMLPLLTLAILLCLGSATPTSADVVGTLNITGAVRINLTSTDFLPAGAPSGVFSVDLFTQSGDFVPLAGTTGTILDLTNQPTGVPFVLPNFLTFAVNPSLRFNLTFIEPGSFSSAQCGAPPAPGQTCTPLGTRFNLVNITSTSSTVSVGVRGLFDDGTGDPPSPYVGVFTTQFANMNYQQLLAAVAAGGTVQASFSANFSPASQQQPIPEPTTMLLLCTGLAGIGIKIRKRRQVKDQ